MNDPRKKLNSGWFASKRRSASDPFHVHCSCDHLLQGTRGPRYQVLYCPSCSKPVFILAHSPYLDTPQRLPHAEDAAGWHSHIPTFINTWKLPLITGAATLVVLLLLLWQLLGTLSRKASPAQLKAHWDQGSRALEEGSFHKALDELRSAARERARGPGILSPEDNRRLDELLAEAELLDRLLVESLGEILRQAMATRSEEWQRHFERDYLGRSILFDGELRLGNAGLPELPFHVVEAGGETARVALEELQLLKMLPLTETQRMIFGARLRWLGRDKQGSWVVEFEPDSGVLITDPSLLASWRPTLVDAATRGVLQRQAGWARGLVRK